jgi:hypothetical protein
MSSRQQPPSSYSIEQTNERGQYPVILLRLLERYLSPKLGSLPLASIWVLADFTRFLHAEKLVHDGPFPLGDAQSQFPDNSLF